MRNFGTQVKHIATVNYMIGGAILGSQATVDLGTGEDGPANIKSKDEIVKYLKDSFAYLHKAFDSITEANVLAPIALPGVKTRLRRWRWPSSVSAIRSIITARSSSTCA